MVVWSAQLKRTIVGAHEQAKRGCNRKMAFRPGFSISCKERKLKQL